LTNEFILVVMLLFRKKDLDVTIIIVILTFNKKCLLKVRII
jgi:hypothetical protein